MRALGSLASLDFIGAQHGSTLCAATNRKGETCGRDVRDYSHFITCQTLSKHNEPHSTLEDIVKDILKDVYQDELERTNREWQPLYVDFAKMIR